MLLRFRMKSFIGMKIYYLRFLYDDELVLKKCMLTSNKYVNVRDLERII